MTKARTPRKAGYKRHPLGEVFPDMSPAERQTLIDDINLNGLRQPIVVYQGMILDGWHRYRGCVAAGRDPEFVTFRGKDPAAFVLSMNLARRHLTFDQRCGIALKFQETFRARAKERQVRKPAIVVPSLMREQKGMEWAEEAGKAVGVGATSIWKACAAAKDDKNLPDKLIAGTAKVSKAYAASCKAEMHKCVAKITARINQEEPLSLRSLRRDMQNMAAALPAAVGTIAIADMDITALERSIKQIDDLLRALLRLRNALCEKGNVKDCPPPGMPTETAAE